MTFLFIIISSISAALLIGYSMELMQQFWQEEK
jgi:hypothetical protein